MALVVLVIVAALAVLRFGLREHLEPRAAVALLHAVKSRWWAIPAYLGLYVLLTAAFVPAVLFHMAAGATWGVGAGVLLNILACNGSAWVQFLAARRLGRERVRWLLERKGAAALEVKLARAGFETMLLIRLLPLPTMAVNMAAGLSPVRWRDFALGTALGTLPIIVIYTWFAAALVEGVEGVRQRILVNLLIAGACLLLVALAPRVWLRLRRRGTDLLP